MNLRVGIIVDRRENWNRKLNFVFVRNMHQNILRLYTLFKMWYDYRQIPVKSHTQSGNSDTYFTLFLLCWITVHFKLLIIQISISFNLTWLTSESAPLSTPGQVNVTNSWHLLWTTKLQTVKTRQNMWNTINAPGLSFSFDSLEALVKA